MATSTTSDAVILVIFGLLVIGVRKYCEPVDLVDDFSCISSTSRHFCVH